MKPLFNIGIKNGDVLGARVGVISILSDPSHWRFSRTPCFCPPPQTFLYITVQNSIKSLLTAVIMLEIRAFTFPGSLLKGSKGKVGWDVVSDQSNENICCNYYSNIHMSVFVIDTI